MGTSTDEFRINSNDWSWNSWSDLYRIEKSNRSVIYNLVCYSIIFSGTFWTNSSERKTTQGKANRKKKKIVVYAYYDTRFLSVFSYWFG